MAIIKVEDLVQIGFIVRIGRMSLVEVISET